MFYRIRPDKWFSAIASDNGISGRVFLVGIVTLLLRPLILLCGFASRYLRGLAWSRRPELWFLGAVDGYQVRRLNPRQLTTDLEL